MLIAVLQSIHSVQQEADARRRRKPPKGHAIAAHGTTSIIDAWGVKTEAAPAVQRAKIVQRISLGNRRRRTRLIGAAAACERTVVRPEPRAVVRSTLPEAMAVLSAPVRTAVPGEVRRPVRGEAGTVDAGSARGRRRGEARDERGAQRRPRGGRGGGVVGRRRPKRNGPRRRSDAARDALRTMRCSDGPGCRAAVRGPRGCR